VAVAAGVVPDSEDAEASLRDVLAAALAANRELARLTAELREENGRMDWLYPYAAQTCHVRGVLSV
jgi:hypothetical protein